MRRVNAHSCLRGCGRLLWWVALVRAWCGGGRAMPAHVCCDVRGSLHRSGDIQLRDIPTIDVEQWISAMHEDGLSASTIRKTRGLLFQTLKAAIRNRVISTNPADGVSLPRMERKEMLHRHPTGRGNRASSQPREPPAPRTRHRRTSDRRTRLQGLRPSEERHDPDGANPGVPRRHARRPPQ